ncbi:hypothetical protein POVWA1_003330 [Plasmodium ovale wallikeri]|uniref:Uncharacterized protein n=1 Tax=Plasmodium ovale wallikeri TaxID=864142 RepID=A0A1A8YHE7_PLAOA|nr:hypothetical protein POVWA1_003330 [Plasmodium ovale wallikeri]
MIRKAQNREEGQKRELYLYTQSPLTRFSRDEQGAGDVPKDSAVLGYPFLPFDFSQQLVCTKQCVENSKRGIRAYRYISHFAVNGWHVRAMHVPAQAIHAYKHEHVGCAFSGQPLAFD